MNPVRARALKLALELIDRHRGEYGTKGRQEEILGGLIQEHGLQDYIGRGVNRVLSELTVNRYRQAMRDVAINHAPRMEETSYKIHQLFLRGSEVVDREFLNSIGHVNQSEAGDGDANENNQSDFGIQEPAQRDAATAAPTSDSESLAKTANNELSNQQTQIPPVATQQLTRPGSPSAQNEAVSDQQHPQILRGSLATALESERGPGMNPTATKSLPVNQKPGAEGRLHSPAAGPGVLKHNEGDADSSIAAKNKRKVDILGDDDEPPKKLQTVQYTQSALPLAAPVTSPIHQWPQVPEMSNPSITNGDSALNSESTANGALVGEQNPATATQPDSTAASSSKRDFSSVADPDEGDKGNEGNASAKRHKSVGSPLRTENPISDDRQAQNTTVSFVGSGASNAFDVERTARSPLLGGDGVDGHQHRTPARPTPNSDADIVGAPDIPHTSEAVQDEGRVVQNSRKRKEQDPQDDVPAAKRQETSFGVANDTHKQPESSRWTAQQLKAGKLRSLDEDEQNKEHNQLWSQILSCTIKLLWGVGCQDSDRASLVVNPSEELRSLYQRLYGKDWKKAVGLIQFKRLNAGDVIEGCLSAAVFDQVFMQELPWRTPNQIMELLSEEERFANRFLQPMPKG